jgi:Spy/CpxP family protein refolding chaperone
MRYVAGVLALTLPLMLQVGCVGQSGESNPTGAATQQPYAGLQNRPLKALPPERVDALLAGRGAEYALAAELNHYPGPLHVLQLGAQLELTPQQEQRAQELYAAVQQGAQPLGRQLVELETQLDTAFGSGAITPAELSRRTDEIAAVEGRLRDVHLAAHVEMKAVLTPEQVTRYDQLRGYSGTEQMPGRHAPGQHG